MNGPPIGIVNVPGIQGTEPRVIVAAFHEWWLIAEQVFAD